MGQGAIVRQGLIAAQSGLGKHSGRAFNDTKARHPDELDSISWKDLVLYPRLSIKVTAYRMRDLIDIVKSEASGQMVQLHTVDQVAAAAYNVGTNALRESFAVGRLGPVGMTYSNEFAKNFAKADQIICRAGYWKCQ